MNFNACFKNISEQIDFLECTFPATVEEDIVVSKKLAAVSAKVRETFDALKSSFSEDSMHRMEQLVNRLDAVTIRLAEQSPIMKAKRATDKILDVQV